MRLEFVTSLAEIEITDLQRRAAQRRIEEDTRHQKHIEDIITKAIPHVGENASPENMDDDWIANLFEKCRIASDEEMQSLWGARFSYRVKHPRHFVKKDSEVHTLI